MIICPKCGNDNPLGRVFCGKCGSKLDFSHTSSQEMTVKTKVTWISENKKKVGYLILLVVLVPVAMALWPQTAPIGKAPSIGGDKKIENAIRGIGDAKRMQKPVSATFGEEDLNAYFVTKGAAWNVASFNVESMQGYFRVRMIRQLASFGSIGDFPIAIKVSYEIVCVPRGPFVNVQKGTFGHLPLPGALKSIASKAIGKVVFADQDWASFRAASDVKAENGRLLVTVKP